MSNPKSSTGEIYVLGISAYYHDSAAALLRNGEIIAAAQEERFTRKKHDPGFPKKAVEYCLKEAGIEMRDVHKVAFYEKPFVKFDRILHSYLACAPRGLLSFLKALPVWLKDKLWMKSNIEEELGYSGAILFPEHHESHAASAFFPSPFQEAAFLTVDGVGEWTTTSWGVGKDDKVSIQGELHFPHSLGLLYSAFTYYTGFRVNSGEYKVMGLAPYGEPRYKDVILKELLDLKEDGSFKLNMRYFDFAAGLRMTNAAFDKLFGGPPRQPEALLTQKEMDLARSVQEATEEVMLRMARHVRKTTGQRNLVLAGGVALNCVANGKILSEKIFDRIWIQPAAGDAGGALGAALQAWFHILGNPREAAGGENDTQKGSYLGPKFLSGDIKSFLDQSGAVYKEVPEADLPKEVAAILANENVVGWVNGRMEFGPRALGARSIIGDARSPKMQEIMNVKIKFRESFRPFAPAVMRERVQDWFEMDSESPYMLLVAQVRDQHLTKMTPEQEKLFGIEKLKVLRSTVPAITHVDYSARVQTVREKEHPNYYRLIAEFEKITGCPVIINTSFNVRGEPIVCSPEEAYRCFMRTNMDYLVLENYILDKREQKALEGDTDWKNEFALD